jgi:hypothetical protein
MTQSSWLANLTCLFVALLATALPAQEPAKKTETIKPPWQRYLQGADEKKAAELEQQLTQFWQAGKFAEALKVAEALAALRQKAQGSDHWQGVDAQWLVAAFRCALKHGEEARKEYTTLGELQRQASTLALQRRYREAQPLLEKVLAIRRKMLGEEHPHTALSYNNLAFFQQAQGQYA